MQEENTSDGILEKQIKILEDKVDELELQKNEVIQEQKYEKAAEIRDEWMKAMDILFKKDPANPRIITHKIYKERFIAKFGFDMIQKLASQGKINVVYKVNVESMVHYSPEHFQETIGDEYNITQKEWEALCTLYNGNNKKDKMISIPREEGGTMKDHDIAVVNKK
jgi:hypothetical protein